MNVRAQEVRNMYKTIEDQYHLNDKTDLVYSYEEYGWYIQDLKNNRTSTSYATRGEACDAYITDSVEWETK